jgi:hypothetical protein
MECGIISLQLLVFGDDPIHLEKKKKVHLAAAVATSCKLSKQWWPDDN